MTPRVPLRVSVANISPAEFATLAQADGIAGSVHANLGFGAWGIEPGVTAEFGGQDERDVRGFVCELLRRRGEQCAYFVNGAGAGLLYADGRVEAL